MKSMYLNGAMTVGHATAAIEVQDPANLEGVEKGDQVQIVYTESVAFEVRKK